LITLATGSTLNGIAGTASAVTYTISGDSVNGGVDTFGVLGQGQLAGSAGALLTTSPVPSSTVYLVKEILLANTTGSNVTGISFYVGGTGGGNKVVGTITIPANGSALYNDDGWHVYDANGYLQYVGATGPQGFIGVQGAQGIQGIQGAQGFQGVIGNQGSQGSQGPQGFQGPTGPVSSVTGTAPIVSSGGGTPAISISAATTSAAGSMSAADKTTVNNMWYDVTNYGVVPNSSGSASANSTAMNTLVQTTAPAGAKFFFPGDYANYYFNGSITVTKNDQTFFGGGQYSTVLFQASTSASLFLVNDGIQNVTFRDIGLWCTVTMTQGAAIQLGASTAGGAGVSQLLMKNVGISGYGGTWFNGVAMYGTVSGEVAIIDGCQFDGYTNWGIACIGNTTTPTSDASAIVQNTTMNPQGSALAGIYIQQAGAFQIVNCDIISNNNNLLISPLVSTSQVVASVYCINSYFDHAVGSSVKIAGAGATVRCKFLSCYFTITSGATGYSAVEMAGTGVIEGISFIGCSFLNTFGNSGTSNGLLVTNAYDFQVVDCVISGFTNGIQVTPIATAAVTRLSILANTIGPGGGLSGNTTGILLNAGSATYGQVQIVDNLFPPTQGSFTANTTNITDNSTVALANPKIITNNVGQPGVPVPITAATAGINTTETYLTPAISLPANSLLVGSTYRLTLYGTCTTTAANVSTFTVRVGTTGTTPASDTTATAAFATAVSGTTGAGVAFKIVIDVVCRAIGASTLFECMLAGQNLNATSAQGIIGPAAIGASFGQAVATGTFNNNTALFLNVSYKSAATTTTSTFQSGYWEVIKQ
jgi:hypothetical protein